MRSCIPQKHPPARIALSFPLISATSWLEYLRVCHFPQVSRAEDTRRVRWRSLKSPEAKSPAHRVRFYAVSTTLLEHPRELSDDELDRELTIAMSITRSAWRLRLRGDVDRVVDAVFFREYRVPEFLQDLLVVQVVVVVPLPQPAAVEVSYFADRLLGAAELEVP